MSKNHELYENSNKNNSNAIYLVFLIIYAGLYEIFDSYNTSFYPTIVSFIQNDLGIGDSEYYLILSIGSLGLYLVIFIQYLSDLIGRKPTAIIAFFGMGLSAYLLGLSHTPISFAISLFIMYIFFSSDSWVILVSEETPKEKRAIYSYIVMILGVIGVFIIPFLRNLLLDPSDYSTWSKMTLIGWLAMPISLLGIFLKESKAYLIKKNNPQFLEKWKKESIISRIREPFKENLKKIMLSFIIISFLIGVNYTSFQTIEKFFTSNLNVPLETISNIIFIAGLGSLVVFGITGFLADKFGRKKIMILYSIILFGGITSLVIATINSWISIVYITVIIAQIGFWGCFTLIKIYCVESFPTEMRGTASGWRSFSLALGFTIGALLASSLSKFINLGTLYIILAIPVVIIVPLLVIKILPETKLKKLIE
ncbi:MAG: MFS transporter [Promethearchaeota archaeon]